MKFHDLFQLFYKLTFVIFYITEHDKDLSTVISEIVVRVFLLVYHLSIYFEKFFFHGRTQDFC